MSGGTPARTVLLVVHPGRNEANETARRVGKVLGTNGIGLRVLSTEAVDRGGLHLAPTDLEATGAAVEVVSGNTRAALGCELVLVLGGDGTFLRAAELARNAEIPVLGINLGRIGFLAEAEAEAIDEILDHVVARDYRIEHRMTLDVEVSAGGVTQTQEVGGGHGHYGIQNDRILHFGLGEACEALEFPIVSGNVSLYNETHGQAILPTPTIGGVGLIDDWSRTGRIAFAAEGETILLIGGPEGWGTHLGQSLYLRDIHERSDGPPPPVDLQHEKAVGDFVRGLIRKGDATAVHDVSDGGIAVAVAEMAMASGIGATIEAPAAGDAIAMLFGEDQGRYLVTVPAALATDVSDRARGLGFDASAIGTTGGRELKLADARAISVDELKAAHEGWFPRFMGETTG